MLRENLKDGAEILQNILHQPLEIPGIQENISLFQATQNPDHSDLSKMLLTFSSNPEPLGILVRELYLIARELKMEKS